MQCENCQFKGKKKANGYVCSHKPRGNPDKAEKNECPFYQPDFFEGWSKIIKNLDLRSKR